MEYFTKEISLDNEKYFINFYNQDKFNLIVIGHLDKDNCLIERIGFSYDDIINGPVPGFKKTWVPLKLLDVTKRMIKNKAFW